MIDIDSLAESAHRSGNPEFYEGEDEPEETLSDELAELIELLDEALTKFRHIKRNHRTRRFNSAERRVEEVFDEVTEIYERGV